MQMRDRRSNSTRSMSSAERVEAWNARSQSIHSTKPHQSPGKSTAKSNARVSWAQNNAASLCSAKGWGGDAKPKTNSTKAPSASGQGGGWDTQNQVQPSGWNSDAVKQKQGHNDGWNTANTGGGNAWEGEIDASKNTEASKIAW